MAKVKREACELYIEQQIHEGLETIIAGALTLILWRAALGVVEGRMTIGDLVLVNAFMIQLYIPLNISSA